MRKSLLWPLFAMPTLGRDAVDWLESVDDYFRDLPELRIADQKPSLVQFFERIS